MVGGEGQFNGLYAYHCCATEHIVQCRGSRRRKSYLKPLQYVWNMYNFQIYFNIIYNLYQIIKYVPININI